MYCLCEILLLLKDTDTHCLGVEFLDLDRLRCQLVDSLLVYLQSNCGYITHVTFTTVTTIFVTRKLKSVT